MIKNIVFDLGGVILNGKSQDVLDNLNISKELKKEIIEKFLNEVSKLDFMDGTIEECYSKSGLNLDEKTKDYVLHYYMHRKYNEDVLSLKDKLSKNYDIYILTNMNTEVTDYLKEVHVLDNVKGVIVSQDYHEVKPNEEIYNILINKYNLIPSECVFIDDNENNVNTAKRLNMNGFIYKDNFNELVFYLRKLGISA